MKVEVKTIVKMAEERMYKDYNIHAGGEKKVCTKVWEKGDKKRTYITIQCFTPAGRFKASFKCGYVDMVTNEYVATQYDDVDLTTSYQETVGGPIFDPFKPEKIKPENLAKALLKRAYQNDFDTEQEKSINKVLDRIKDSTDAKGSTFADDYEEFYQLLINLAN